MAPRRVTPSSNPIAPARGRGRGRPSQNGPRLPQPNSSNLPYRCVICGRSFERRQGLSGHMNAHRRPRVDVSEQESSVCTAESTTTTLVPRKMPSGPGGISVGGLLTEVLGPLASNGLTLMAEGERQLKEEEVEQLVPGLVGQVSPAGVLNATEGGEKEAIPAPADARAAATPKGDFAKSTGGCTDKAVGPGGSGSEDPDDDGYFNFMLGLPAFRAGKP
ncbi:hypothetical protein Ancab_013725 [Ancistrocladus abbreviatus]